MKTFTKLMSCLLFGLLTAFFSEPVNGQSVLDPNDPIVNYNASSPPTQPPYGQFGKWVRTKRLSWNTDAYKAYIYKGYGFRLKFPKTYNHTANDGKTYPIIIMFHGRGEAAPNTDNEYCMYHGGKQHLDAVNAGIFDGYILYLQGGQGWADQHFDVITEILEYMTANNKLNPFRVSVHGLSAGGAGAWAFMVRHPTWAAAGLPMSGTHIDFKDNSVVQKLKYTSIWDFQGGQDNNPAPYTSQQVYNAFIQAGGNFKHTIYPELGHGVWNTAYAETDFFYYMLRAHKANPWALGGRTEFCPGQSINITLGVTAGFSGYEWRKDGVVIPNATSNTLQVTTEGVYDCRVKRGNLWSEWSPIPADVKYKGVTYSPDPKVFGMLSKVLPTPETNATTLFVPAGYASYTWQKVGSGTTLSTDSTVTVNSPGQYRVRVTEQFGCSSEWSNPFTVVDANGPNKPDAAINATVTTLSKTELRVNWSDNPSPAYNETNFEVYMSKEPGGNYKLVGIKDADVLNHTVTGLDANTTYYFRVRAVNATGAAALSNEASGITQADLQAPSAPTNLVVTSSTRSSINISWTPATDDIGVTQYDIYVNGQKSYVTGNTSFNVQGLQYGQSYNLTVKARDLAGNTSPASNQITAQALFSGLTYKYYINRAETNWSNLPNFATLIPDETGVVSTVTTAPRTQDEKYGFLWEGYIYIPVAGSYTFRTNSDDGSKLYLGNAGQLTSPYSHTATPLVNNDGAHGSQNRDGSRTLQPGLYPIAVTYFQAGGGAAMTVSWRVPGNSSFVQIPASAFAEPPFNNGSAPAAPSKLLANPVSYKQIDLSWVDNSNNETGFEIYRSTNENNGYATVGTAPANATSYTDTFALNPATRYYYKIRALGQYGESDLVSYSPVLANWKLNNNYNDAGGTNRTLSQNGGLSFDASDKAEGSHSLYFSGGSNRYATLNNVSYLQGAHSERTIAFWMKSASNTGNRLIVDIGGSDDGFALRLNSNTLYAGVASNNARSTISAPYNFTGWKHIALVYKERTLRLYIDGNLAASTTTLNFTSLGTTTNASRIGSTNGTNAFNTTSGYTLFNGRLDDFGIFSVALEQSEINALRNQQSLLSSAATTLPLPAAPAAPSQLLASGISKSGIEVKWNDNANNELGYELYRSGNNNSNYVLLATLPANTTTYNDEGLFPNSVFYYKVRAVNIGGASNYSNEDSAATKNTAPAITAIPNQSMRFGTQLDVNVQATDPDSEPMDIVVTGLPAFGTYISNGNGTGIIRFTPGVSDQGNYNDITVTVNDQHQGTASVTFNLVVNDNYVPVISQVNNVTLDENQSSQVNLSVTDQNATDVLTWSFEGLPEFANLTTDGNSASISLTPGYADHGTYNVIATVNDGKGGVATREFVINVNDVNPNKKYYINFTIGSASNVLAGAPWNNTNKAPALNDNYPNLKDDAGNTTNVGFRILTDWAMIFNATSASGMVTGNNSGVYPDAVLRSSFYTTSYVQTIRFYGLDVNTKYNFTFSASRTGTAGENRTGIYTINGNSVSLNAVNNTQNTVTLYDLQPEPDGTLLLSFQRGAGATYAHINSVVIEAKFDQTSLPAKPRNVAAAMQGNQVKVSWVDAAYNEAAYEVYRAADFNGPYTLLNESANNADTEEYLDGNISGNTTYYYTVRAINATGGSPFGDTVAITTANTAPIVANIANVNMVTEQVLDVQVSATDDPGDIITLSASGLPAFASFTDNGNGTGVVHLAPGFALGTFNGLTVTATDHRGASASKQFSVTVTPSDPNAPINLAAVGASRTSIKLTWTDRSNVETGFQIFRSNTADGTFSQVGTVGANVTTFTDATVSGTTLFYYKVRATLSGGNFSGYTNTAGAAPVLSLVYINFNDEYPVGAPWNNTNVGPSDGDKYENLVNDAGIGSGMDLTVEGTGFTGVNHTGMNTGNNSGIYPDNIIRNSWFLDRGNVAQIRISGLNLSHAYTFTFFGSRDGSGTNADRTTKWTINGVSDSINTINNINKTAEISNVRPDANGTVLITIEAGGASPYGYMGALVIKSYSIAGGSSEASGGSGARQASVVTATQETTPVTTPVNVSIIESKNEVTAFPNPFISDISVRLSLGKPAEKLTVILSDISGRTIFRKEMSNVPQGTSQFKLDYDGRRLAPGMYLVSLIGIDKKPVVIKVLKNR